MSQSTTSSGGVGFDGHIDYELLSYSISVCVMGLIIYVLPVLIKMIL